MSDHVLRNEAGLGVPWFITQENEMPKHRVTFTAEKKVEKPVTVKFQTDNGPVKFKAHETVKEPVRVSFIAKDKK